MRHLSQIAIVCLTALLMFQCFVCNAVAQQEKDSSKTNAKTTDSTKPKVKRDDSPPASGLSTKDRTHVRNDLTFDDLKFEMKPTERFDRKMLTKKINGYHGTTVKIRGFIRPNTKQNGITRFVFVRDNKECCFGPKAAIFDNILVKLAPEKSTRYTVRPITVEGKFALKEYKGPDGKVWSLYRLYQAEVK